MHWEIDGRTAQAVTAHPLLIECVAPTPQPSGYGFASKRGTVVWSSQRHGLLEHCSRIPTRSSNSSGISTSRRGLRWLCLGEKCGVVLMSFQRSLKSVGQNNCGDSREYLRFRQKLTFAGPFRSNIARASSGVAISKESSSRIRLILLTCSALLVASFPLPA